MPPNHGKASVTKTGEIEYKPNENYHGTDTLKYTVKDKSGNYSNPATVSITVSQLPFKITVKTDNQGTSNDNEFTVPITGGTYDIDCGGTAATNASNVTGNYTCSYKKAGTYTISIMGDIPQISFPKGSGCSHAPAGDSKKLISIDQWGTGQWENMESTFYSSNTILNAKDNPDFSKVTSMKQMFIYNKSFNQDISAWDTSKVTNMNLMFAGATAFNQDLSKWDISNVKDMSSMFRSVTLSPANYDKMLISWDAQSLVDGNWVKGRSFGGGGNKPSSDKAKKARSNLISREKWKISDGL